MRVTGVLWWALAAPALAVAVSVDTDRADRRLGAVQEYGDKLEAAKEVYQVAESTVTRARERKEQAERLLEALDHEESLEYKFEDLQAGLAASSKDLKAAEDALNRAETALEKRTRQYNKAAKLQARMDHRLAQEKEEASLLVDKASNVSFAEVLDGEERSQLRREAAHFRKRQRDAARSAMLEELAQLVDPWSSLPTVFHMMGRHVEPDGELHYLGGDPRPHDIVISRRQYTFAIVSYFVLWSVGIAFVAYLYRLRKVWPAVDPEREYTDFTKWSSGPFDCMQDPKICVWSFLCPCIRFADNVSMLGIINFWFALAMMTCVWLMNSMSGGALLWMASALVWMFFRQTFRRKFDMAGQHECSYYLGDCMLYLFCAPCAIAQEARQLELAARADHEAVKAQRPEVQP